MMSKLYRIKDLKKDLEKLSKAQTDNFIELAGICNLDPKEDFIGADLKFMDLSGLDLRKFDFRNADFRWANISGTKFDPSRITGAKFDRKSKTSNRYIQSAVKKIWSISRQEERIALLLKEILKNPKRGKEILDLYGEDRAKFSSNVISYMKYIADQKDNIYEIKDIIEIMRWSIKECFPMSRGVLIYFFALHMSDNKGVKIFLADFVNQNNSIYMSGYKNQISRILDVNLEKERLF
jgi:hypothetical protein